MGALHSGPCNCTVAVAQVGWWVVPQSLIPGCRHGVNEELGRHGTGGALRANALPAAAGQDGAVAIPASALGSKGEIRG
jgi:hypothetical protein